MADENLKHANLVFGSAGMAASGMLPTPKKKSKPVTPKAEPQVMVTTFIENPQPTAEAVAEPAPAAVPTLAAPQVVTCETPIPTAPAELSSVFELDTTQPQPQTVPTVQSQPTPVATPTPAPVAAPAPNTVSHHEPQAILPAPELKESARNAFKEALEPTPQPQHGYGINDRAQGVYRELTLTMIGDGMPRIAGPDWSRVIAGTPNLKVEGGYDPDPQQQAQLNQQYQLETNYDDYRGMLSDIEPDLVVVPHQGTKDRYETVKSALLAGSHVISSAPFTQSLSQADELVALASRRGLKVAVNMPMRLDPNVQLFHKNQEATIGELVEIRVFGEMQQASGGADLLVHGTPLFDLVRMFAGRPVWCTSSIMTNGSRSTRDDIAEDPADLLGPLVGDTINAQICTEKGIMVSFISDPKLAHVSGGWGIEFVGSSSVMRLYAADRPVLSLLQNPGRREADLEQRWATWPGNRQPYHPQILDLQGSEAALRMTIDDWLSAIAEDRAPTCSAQSATEALEMSHAIFQAGITGKKIYFPMVNRHHPLTPELRPGPAVGS